METKQEKSKEQILAERKAKKSAKKQPSNKIDQAASATTQQTAPPAGASSSSPTVKSESPAKTAVKKEPQVQLTEPIEAEKTKEEILAERKAKKLAKQSGSDGSKKKSPEGDAVKITLPQKQQLVDKNHPKKEVAKQNSDTDLSQKMESLHITQSKTGDDNQKENKPQMTDDQNVEKGKPTSKAERRAIQEAQRAAKAKLQAEKTKTPVSAAKKTANTKETKAKSETLKTISTSPPAISQKSSALHKVRLFKHLYTEKCDLNIKVNSRLHPAIIRLGAQYANNTIVGCNARCYAFLNAMQIVSDLPFYCA
jgi:translation initiation factor eIF-2B subunit delta